MLFVGCCGKLPLFTVKWPFFGPQITTTSDPFLVLALSVTFIIFMFITLFLYNLLISKKLWIDSRALCL